MSFSSEENKECVAKVVAISVDENGVFSDTIVKDHVGGPFLSIFVPVAFLFDNEPLYPSEDTVKNVKVYEFIVSDKLQKLADIFVHESNRLKVVIRFIFKKNRQCKHDSYKIMVHLSNGTVAMFNIKGRDRTKKRPSLNVENDVLWDEELKIVRVLFSGGYRTSRFFRRMVVLIQKVKLK